MIETFHLSKLYSRGVYALRDLTITIDKGEFLFLTGPSGGCKGVGRRAVAGTRAGERPSGYTDLRPTSYLAPVMSRTSGD